MLNFQAFSNAGLELRLKNLLQAEPPHHSALACRNPLTCETCIRWRRWALQVSTVNKEMNRRRSK